MRDEVVPCHLFHDVDGEHFEWMGVEMQGTENLLETTLSCRDWR